MKQVALDQFVHHPFVLFPAFYCVKVCRPISPTPASGSYPRKLACVGTLGHAAPVRRRLQESIEASGHFGRPELAAAWSKYLANFREDCIVTWRCWIPAFFLNFSVLPIWGRVPFVACVSLGFTSYFSFLRGSPQEAPQQSDGS